MTGRRIKQAIKCKKCGKILRRGNKSGLCSHHYKMQYFKKKRAERKAKHLCIICGGKVKQTNRYNAVYPDKPVKVYSVRCPRCQKRQNESYQRNKEKRKEYEQKPEVKARRRERDRKKKLDLLPSSSGGKTS